MPEIYPITSNVFPGLLERLGVRLTAPRAPLYYLSDVVMPVTIVDSGITFAAVVDPGVQLFATEGQQTAPLINDLLADTGALPVGNYEFKVWLAHDEQVFGPKVAIEHRDALNTGNIWSHHFYFTNIPGFFHFECSVALAEDERLRLRVEVGATAARVYNGIIFRRFLT